MTIQSIPRYLAPSHEAGRAFVMWQMHGPLVMLNLLRFKATADYSASPELAPPDPISGAAAFQRYIEHTMPHLLASGGELVSLGTGGPFLIGPEHEHWDAVMLVRQQSAESFLAFASHAGYLAGIGHRTAALEDSRLLPLTAPTLVIHGSHAPLIPPECGRDIARNFESAVFMLLDGMGHDLPPQCHAPVVDAIASNARRHFGSSTTPAGDQAASAMNQKNPRGPE